MSSGWFIAEDDETDVMLSEYELTAVEKERTLDLLKDAVEAIEEHKKTAYQEACSRGVIESESDPMMFLRRTQFDPWHAASRLVEYWQHRVDIFGRDRAFRKLFDLSGEGCLNEADIEVLKSGFYCDLPIDEYGHSVVIYDKSRLSVEHRLHRIDSQSRVVLYMLGRCALNPLSHTEGIVFILMCHLEIEDLRFIRPLARIFELCLPVKSYRDHFMYTIQTRVAIPFFTLPQDLKTVFDGAFKGIAPPLSKRFHFGRGPEDFFAQLKTFGLSMDGLPPTLGGIWHYGNFACRLQMQNCAALQPSTSTDPLLMGTFQRLSWQELVMRIVSDWQHEHADSLIWKLPLGRLKKALFGNRAIFAVNSTGYGALSLMDLYVLNDSYFQVLDTDQRGRTVISFQSNRLHVTIDEQMRILYYLLSVAAENSASFEKGIVLLLILEFQFFLNSFGLENIKEMTEMFQMKAEVHIVLEPPPFDISTTMYRTNIPIRLGSLIAGSNVYVHDVSENLARIMRLRHGLTVLPESIGGTWTDDDHRKWRRDRLQVESSREFERVCRSLQSSDIFGPENE